MITLLVPTMNRSEFVVRLLDYYDAQNFKHHILIGDSSTPDHVERIQSAIRSHQGLKVEFMHLPGASLGTCFKKMSQAVKSPYVAPVPDDDYLIPAGVDKCIDFLEKHSDYVAANGEALLYHLDKHGPYGDVVLTGRYSQRGYEGKTATERLSEFFHNYSVVVFAVHRTPAWNIMWDACDAIADVPIASEILPCALSAVLGKIKHFPFLYLTRQMHDARYLTKDRYDTVISPNWYPSIHAMMDRLAEHLQKTDNLSKERAQAVTKRETWYYFAHTLMHDWNKFHGKPRRNIKKTLASKAPSFVRNAIQSARSFTEEGKFSLASLRRKSSPFYRDFSDLEKVLLEPKNQATFR